MVIALIVVNPRQLALACDPEVREILEFIQLHRLLYDVVPGTMKQPSGLGEDWSVLKQRVYGTLTYEPEFNDSWLNELGDPAQKAETLAYIRTKKDDLVARLKAAGKAA